ncbi:DNA repair protein RecN [Nonlabens sp. SCSIO 43208]|uniref:DNA repair protein RecN n=1 Tax=Nonlabens sp. SCSIO 43208 TaxID=2793009 RepID=UPI003D6C0DD7
MLTSIHIQNFALIEHLDLDVSTGLTTITGETGAGKSIVLGALGLILGQRADLSVVRDSDSKCVVEAHFNLSSLDLKKVFEDLDLDHENHTILRRIILPSGKSRAFVNDLPVTLSVLQQLGGYLIDIHSQHDTRDLIRDSFQREVLDAHVAFETKNKKRSFLKVLSDYQRSFTEFKSLKRELKTLEEKEHNLIKENDYNIFLLGELEDFNLESIDLELLEEEQEQLGNVESIKEGLGMAFKIVNEDDHGVVEQLRSSIAAISGIKRFSSLYSEIDQRLSSTLVELEDIVETLEREFDNIEADPSRLAEIDETLNTIQNLFKKHQTDSISELIVIRDELAAKVLETSSLDKRKTELNKLLSEKHDQCTELSSELMGMRIMYKDSLEKKLDSQIQSLGMPHAQLNCKVESSDSFHNLGKDVVGLLFTANMGSTLKPIEKAASGGELSRVMLAIKSQLAVNKKLPTIIFDEIDTGVSGAIAEKMASIMQVMSESMQVIAITHLPQIAARGHEHLLVEKKIDNEKTISNISKLDASARIEEIAQMLSGGKISDAARENARVLLQ